ncbi:MAG: hypothetical protein U0Y10_25115 [Spirosomataceae bacterium]
MPLLLLLDENIDVRLSPMLAPYGAKTIRDMNWLGKSNGELMRLIVEQGFNIFITTDKNLPFQQNLSALKYALWVLDTPSNDFQTLQLFVPAILNQLAQADNNQPIQLELQYISVAGISTGKKLKKT